jgi:hypothetical protein
MAIPARIIPPPKIRAKSLRSELDLPAKTGDVIGIEDASFFANLRPRTGRSAAETIDKDDGSEVLSSVEHSTM